VPVVATPPDFRLSRFSSDALPPPERFDVWRDTVTRYLVHVALDPAPGHRFFSQANLRAQHGMRVGFGLMSACVHHRTRQIVAADNDDLVLLLNSKGASALVQAGREVALGEGDASILDCSQPGAYEHRVDGKLTCVRFSRQALAPFLLDTDGCVARLIPVSSTPLRLLTSYLTLLEHDEPDLMVAPDISRTVIGHVYDLLALTLGAHRDAAAYAAGRGLRAARLRALKLYIAERIGPHRLTIEEVAAHEGISPRYVRKLFESVGTNFSAYVAGERLKRAHAMLTAPRFAAMSISSVAFEVGFDDLSNFNRAFRRRFDATPREVRREAADCWAAGDAIASDRAGKIGRRG
jgi:AraC-like DNA-binding protein